MKNKMIDIDKIHINLLNPRYVEQESEDHEIEQIIENGDIEKLMKDIARHGLDPSENLLLTFEKEFNEYTVHEGNRRITALKLLKDPDLVPIFINNRETYVLRIKDIIKTNNYSPITQVSAVVMDNIELMNHFIELKHTKNKGGAGRLDWKPEDQARFNKVKDPFKNNLLEMLTNILPGKTNDFNFTTIERIIGDPDMRKALTMVINKSNGQITFQSSQGFDKFKYIVSGLSNKRFTVKDFYYKEDRENFIDQHLKYPLETKNEILAPDKEDPIIFSVQNNMDDREITEEILEPLNLLDDIPTEKDALIEDIPLETSNKIKRYKKQPEPKKRPYFFHGIKYTGDIYGIKHSLYEIHSLDTKLFPLATTMLFRTLFECVIQQYIIVNKIDIKSKSPIESLSIATLLKTCTDNSNRNFKTLEDHNKSIARIILEANSQRDQDELNIVTHGNYRGPSYIKLEDIERRWFEAIKMMIEKISDHN